MEDPQNTLNRRCSIGGIEIDEIELSNRPLPNPIGSGAPNRARRTISNQIICTEMKVEVPKKTVIDTDQTSDPKTCDGGDADEVQLQGRKFLSSFVAEKLNKVNQTKQISLPNGQIFEGTTQRDEKGEGDETDEEEIVDRPVPKLIGTGALKTVIGVDETTAFIQDHGVGWLSFLADDTSDEENNYKDTDDQDDAGTPNHMLAICDKNSAIKTSADTFIPICPNSINIGVRPTNFEDSGYSSLGSPNSNSESLSSVAGLARTKDSTNGNLPSFLNLSSIWGSPVASTSQNSGSPRVNNVWDDNFQKPYQPTMSPANLSGITSQLPSGRSTQGLLKKAWELHSELEAKTSGESLNTQSGFSGDRRLQMSQIVDYPQTSRLAKIPQTFPSAVVPQTCPSAVVPQTFLSAVVPQTFPSAVVPQTFPSAVVPQIFPSAVVPQTFPSDVVLQTFPSAVVPQTSHSTAVSRNMWIKSVATPPTPAPPKRQMLQNQNQMRNHIQNFNGSPMIMVPPSLRRHASIYPGQPAVILPSHNYHHMAEQRFQGFPQNNGFSGPMVPPPPPAPPRYIWAPIRFKSVGQPIQTLPPFINKFLNCTFCQENMERPLLAYSHLMRDPETFQVICPVLRNYLCKICGATQAEAHTEIMCPYNSENLRIVERRLAAYQYMMGRPGNQAQTPNPRFMGNHYHYHYRQ